MGPDGELAEIGGGDEAAPRYPVLAITHIHTDASNGLASEMDPLIGGALRSVLGQDTPVRWSECFTRVERVRAVLDAPPPATQVGIVCITDHMNRRAHRLPEALLRAAAEEPRLCVGGELACVEQDIDGRYRQAPEVLVYGGPAPVDGPFGAYTGLTQARIDDIFARCRAPGHLALQTRRVLDHCAEHGLACALAHPLDGHELSLDATLELLGRARFIETVNGGFPTASTEVLEAYLALHNRVALGAPLPEVLWRYPRASRLAEQLARARPAPIVAMGGSDAHSHAFDRVTWRFLASTPRPTAAELLRAMLGTPTAELLARGTFAIVGRPGSGRSVLDDVVRIVIRNLWFNRAHFQKPPIAASVVALAAKVVRQELKRRDRRQAEFLAEARLALPGLQALGLDDPAPDSAALG